MGKQMEFTEQEQEKVTNAIIAINKILLLKMDDGVTELTLEGTMDIEDKKVVFSFIAQKFKR